jgi:hypothetical protein
MNDDVNDGVRDGVRRGAGVAGMGADAKALRR